jgi:hypothetical protein
MPLSNCEFHENQCKENYILLKELDGVLPVFSIFFFIKPERKNGTGDVCKNLSTVIFVKIGTGKVVISYGRQLNYMDSCAVKPYNILKVKNACVQLHGLHQLQLYFIICTLAAFYFDITFSLMLTVALALSKVIRFC